MNEHVQARMRVGELVVEDNVDALNTALQRAGIDPQDVLAVLQMPPITPAIGDHRPKLRVLYRRTGMSS